MNGSNSLSDLMKRWKVSRRTLYRWIKGGQLLPLKTPGGHYRITEEEITRFEHEVLGGTDNSNKGANKVRL